MFSLCEAMKWNHLPVAGGIYDQDPDLLDGFQIILSLRAEHEAEEDRKTTRGKGMGASGSPSRRPRRR